jgi:hypothetical protein
MFTELASYRHSLERINKAWASFLDKRARRLKQENRVKQAVEKVAEDIVQDLFTEVLDWDIADLNNQLELADIVLTRNDVRYLLLEVKRPGELAWHRTAIEKALNQAWSYADQQKIKVIAITDGAMLYAADVVHGGLHDRVFARLDSEEPQESLWWLSLHGIYRERSENADAALPPLPHVEPSPAQPPPQGGQSILHPKYQLPASCFAYIGNASDPRTWKLPYLLADGRVDLKRLPKAVGAILSNYRGVKVSGIPDRDIPDVLQRLAHAAASVGKMPAQCGESALVYRELAEALEQVGRGNQS